MTAKITPRPFVRHGDVVIERDGARRGAPPTEGDRGEERGRVLARGIRALRGEIDMTVTPNTDAVARLTSPAELQEMVQTLTRERDEARRQVAVLTEGLRLVSDALARLNQIYQTDIDLGDPPVETPMWLQEAQYRAAALLAPHHPDAGAVEQAEKGGRDA